MTRLHDSVTDTPTMHVGLGGNYYVVCSRRLPILEIAEALSRSWRGVYWSERHQCWAIRVRRTEDKAALKRLMGGAAA